MKSHQNVHTWPTTQYSGYGDTYFAFTKRYFKDYKNDWKLFNNILMFLYSKEIALIKSSIQNLKKYWWPKLSFNYSESETLPSGMEAVFLGYMWFMLLLMAFLEKHCHRIFEMKGALLVCWMWLDSGMAAWAQGWPHSGIVSCLSSRPPPPPSWPAAARSPAQSRAAAAPWSPPARGQHLKGNKI